MKGLEPSRPKAHAPKACVSTNSTTSASIRLYHKVSQNLYAIIVSSMSKVADYLQSHLLGEIYTRMDVREAYAHDGSVLTQKPEFVVYPRNVNDVRKIMRFAWQLAEKGHKLPVTVSGGGGDVTGASLSKGTIIDMSRHMDQIFEYDAKQKLLRLQPGASAAAIQSALRLHGTLVPSLDETTTETLGGAIGNDTGGYLSGSMGTMRQWVSQLEVVLDNGEILQTGRISKRELNKLRGVTGRVGDIYRGIDTVLEDHKELLDELAKTKEDIADRSGYPGIVSVRGKGGSIDLTPLFLGAQGTLGVVVEAIIKAEFTPKEPVAAALFFTKASDARDAADELAATDPSALEYYDGRFFTEAGSQGKTFQWLGDVGKAGAVIWMSYHSFNQRWIKKSLKKLTKIADKYEANLVTSNDHDFESMLSLRSMPEFVDTPSGVVDHGAVPLLDGVYVPSTHFEQFVKNLSKLEKSLHMTLPLEGSLLSSTFRVHPTLNMRKVSDKQKVFKLLDELTNLVESHDGALVGVGGEGRLLGRFARRSWDEEYEQMMEEIRKVFDPFGILNPEAKQAHELKTLVGMLSSSNPKKK